MDPEKYEVTARALSDRWGVHPGAAEETRENRELLLDAIQERVADLIKRDFDKLRIALYRLDVPEDRYKAAWDQPGLDAKARAIAELILERETEKAGVWVKHAQEQRKRQTGIVGDEPDKELPDASE
ncbi:MAG: hypothetical protein ACLFTT_07200 [Candidatus Hydrogenedentota bacterium]